MNFLNKLRGIPISSLWRSFKGKLSITRRKALDMSEKLFWTAAVIFIILAATGFFANKILGESILNASSDFNNQVLVISQLDEGIRDKNVSILKEHGIDNLEDVDIDGDGVLIIKSKQKTYMATQNEDGLIIDIKVSE